MAATAFEIINNSTFRIEEKVLSGHFSDPPFDGKYRYHLHGTSDQRDAVGQHLFIHDFRKVRPVDLPNGIAITIQCPKSEFRQVSFADIRKVDDQSELIIILCFDYVDWHLPINLQHFAEHYRSALLDQVDGATHSHIDQTEVGLFIHCSVVVAPDVNYLVAYRKADSQVLATYRRCLEDIYKQQATMSKTKRPQSEDSAGAKWWFRYVIVPVVGSGAVAAIATGLVALVK